MQGSVIFAIGMGAAIGAWLRYALGMALNPTHPHMPLGTLSSNLMGAYLIGVAVAYFSNHPGITHEMRLFIVTGFLGGLTTFSTFSSESVTLLMRAQYGWAIATICAHVFGSLTMTIAGIWTVKLIR
jgi:fluoride exporter